MEERVAAETAAEVVVCKVVVGVAAAGVAAAGVVAGVAVEVAGVAVLLGVNLEAVVADARSSSLPTFAIACTSRISVSW